MTDCRWFRRWLVEDTGPTVSSQDFSPQKTCGSWRKRGIHVCQGNIWSQHAVDNGDARARFAIRITLARAFLQARSGQRGLDRLRQPRWLDRRFPVCKICRLANDSWHPLRSRQGVGPIETLLVWAPSREARRCLHTAAHFDKGFELNNFAWVTSIWELCLVEAQNIRLQGRNGIDGLVIWLTEIRRRWPEAKCITHGEFGMLWREQFRNNDNLDYRFVQRGYRHRRLGRGNGNPLVMNKDSGWPCCATGRQTARKSLSISPAMTSRPGNLPIQHPVNTAAIGVANRLNQKGVRPQDQPIPIGQLTAEIKRSSSADTRLDQRQLE